MGPGKRMTKAERDRITAVKEGVCVACLCRAAAGLLPHPWIQVGHSGTSATYQGMLEAHHIKSGNIRVGHFATVGLCQWHHRGNQAQPPDGWTHRTLRDRYGLSLADGSAAFHDAYGSDAELLEIQDAYHAGELML